MHTSIIVETVVVARNRRAARPPDMCNDPEVRGSGKWEDGTTPRTIFCVFYPYNAAR